MLFSRVLRIRFCLEDGGRAIPLNYCGLARVEFVLYFICLFTI